MINLLIDSIAEALNKEFGDSYTIYTENIPQGFKEPCFAVTCTIAQDVPYLIGRRLKKCNFDVHYFPDSRDMKNADMHSVASRLQSALEYVNVEDGLVRGTGMSSEIIDDVLHFFVNYDKFVGEAEVYAPKFEELIHNGYSSLSAEARYWAYEFSWSKSDIANVFGGDNAIRCMPDDTPFPDTLNVERLDNRFHSVEITSLPKEWMFDNLVYANAMFTHTLLTSLPEGMKLNSLKKAVSMFWNAELRSLPDSLELANLESAESMFNSCRFAKLPPKMTLSKLKMGRNMFVQVPLIEASPNLNLSSLEYGTGMFKNALFNAKTAARIIDTLPERTEDSPGDGVFEISVLRKYISNPDLLAARDAAIARGWNVNIYTNKALVKSAL